MGWLGWTEQQTLNTSMPAIVLAYEGRMDMLKACFGEASETPPAAVEVAAPVAPPPPPPTAQSFQAVLRALAK